MALCCHANDIARARLLLPTSLSFPTLSRSLQRFKVSDMDRKIYELIALGGRLDGAIEYLPTGKVAAMRSPDGHMIGLHETG